MIITPIKCDPAEFGLGVSSGHRTAGLHISEIYNDLFQKLEPKRYDKSRPMDPLRLEMGLLFESILEEGLKAKFQGGKRPGELVTEEGIIYSPDLIIFDRSVRLGEIKLTWMSSREVPRTVENGLPSKFDKYICQMKAYCYHLDTRDARLIALFVNGDYTVHAPELLGWDLEFSQRELDENWRMLLNHARHTKMLS